MNRLAFHSQTAYASAAVCIMLSLFAAPRANSLTDRGPYVTISGEPGPKDVYGEIDGTDEFFNPIVLQTGDTIAVTISATAYGNRQYDSAPNKINEISLWAIKVNPGPPQIGNGGGSLGDGNPASQRRR